MNINTAERWDLIWSEEGLDTWRIYWDKFQWIVDRVNIGCRVLDIGCGVGVLMSWLQNKKACDVYGLDISPVAIKYLFEQGLYGVISTLPSIPFPDDTFDVVVGSELIEHLDEPQKTLESARRVLKPGGLFIGTTPNNLMPQEEVPEHQRTWTKDQLFALFDGVFDNVKVLELITRQGCTPYGDNPVGNKLRPLPILVGTGTKGVLE